ncbi:30S ribosomal protein S17, chloroplastic [Tetrabaena socialis]|uniref:Small ribosomal subunit protein uS17c n=1 Tax=Tetrabaena socialis TaxID=47790 RepID=A0A2J8A2R5_9CHLO|nr:30S ribosomal protein S17, chloroplastic [Tetrabaena socialis]|eukprot:PNH06803.1 30S ribosomal protein S17, chloroplastic [Tetrabaena socialis]
MTGRRASHGLRNPSADSVAAAGEYTCSCCNRGHALAIYRALRAVADDPRFSRACLAWQTRLACRVCDPEVGVGLKPAVCRSACDEWLAACRDEYFTFEGAAASTSFLGGRLLPCASPEALAAVRGAGGGGGDGEGSGPLLCSRLGDVARDGEELCREAGFTVAGRATTSSSSAGAGLGGAAGAVAAVLAAGARNGKEEEEEEGEEEGGSCFDGSPTASFRTDFCQPPPPPARAPESQGRRRKGAGDGEEEGGVSSPVYFLAVAVIASVLWLTYTTRQGFQRKMQSSVLRSSALRPAVCSRQSVVAVRAVQEVKGVVVSAKMNKTVVVEAERLSTDPVYLKRKKVTKRYLAHDEAGTTNVGDFVRLNGVRPMSKTKRFAVSEVLRKAE